MGPLVRLAEHDSPVVRAHAVWAVNKLGGLGLLAVHRRQERDPVVLEEYEAAAAPDEGSD